jgi:leucyl-tRNA synthetase
MGNYDFQAIEAKWQQYWRDNRTFAIEKDSSKPKYYVLDMFPYPSGAGLHVGHPLGYIATDIVARYRKLAGFNVLHPMGFDAFGLPAEQYAIETGQHPAITTEKNIQTYKEQFARLGLAHEPDSTDMRTSDPGYYRWTQWIFLKIFHSWYNLASGKAEPIETLIAHLDQHGTEGLRAYTDYAGAFTAAEWRGFPERKQHEILLDYRMAYTAYTEVNWCPALGTVLANDEVVNGVSERGGHPVIRKPMRQWAFRMRAYADRLLAGLNEVQWPESIKEQQRNWIGRSEGANFYFEVAVGQPGNGGAWGELFGNGGAGLRIEVFSTRPDTVFGATFMVLAPEHPLVEQIVTEDRRAEVMEYAAWARNRSEVERQQEKKITGKFTGAYAKHPFVEGRLIPIWTADYVLWGYGTGAIMAVPAGDSRDYAFAKHFGLEIIPIIEGVDISEEAYETKEGRYINSGFLDGMEVKEGIRKAIDALEENGIGKARVNYRLRDPNFSRQRYWGEPFPIVFRDGLPYALDASELPIVLPEVDRYEPGEEGEGPLANISDWVNLPDGSRRETNTMPGYAGSSWYFLRYFDVDNSAAFSDKSKASYWMNVDLYVGGSEHAVGHLLYSRYWTKVLYDLGFIAHDEPFQKLVNQGMIQGRSSIMYRLRGSNVYVSAGFVKGDAVAPEFREKLLHDLAAQGVHATGEVDPIHVDVNIVENDILDLERVRTSRGGEYANAEFVTEKEGVFHCGFQIEKMSKRYYNVVNPNDVCDRYGADTLRLYEMFLGPLEDAKPWSTHGIEGCFRFLRRVWNLFVDDQEAVIVTDAAPTADELRVLHQTIAKVQEDIQNLSFNTTVAQYMKFLNEAQRLKTTSRAVLEPFLVVLSPFAPHFCEELWEKLGNTGSIAEAAWPVYEEKHVAVSSINYPIQVNGKVKGQIIVAADLTKEEVEKEVLASSEVQALLGGQELKKMIVVPGRIVNLVV